MAGPLAIAGGGAALTGLGAVGMWMWNNLKDHNRAQQESEEERQARKKNALVFLGKNSSSIVQYEKPANSIVPAGAPLDSIAGGLLPPSTIVPEIDTSAIVSATFAGIIQEIQKINSNIVAIRDAMLASSIIESNHRQQIIADLEQAIANRDKDSSLERAEDRREDVEENESTPEPGKVGRVVEAMKQIGIISGIAIFAEFIAALKSGTAGKFLFGDGKTPDMEGGGIVSGPDSGYQVTAHGTEMFIPLNNKATDNILGNEVTPSGSMFAENISNNSLTSSINNNTSNNSSSFALNNNSSIFGSNSLGSSSYFTSGSNTTSLISSNSSFNTLIGDDEGSLTVIDMRTAKQLANNGGSSNPKSGNEIITLSPERRMSPYEPFVTHHV